MEKDTKHTVIAVIALIAIIIVIFAGVYTASGVSPPQTIVESESMQHGDTSQIGVIDTGDMVLLKDKSKVDIMSYVDGYNAGYSTFGSYGNVIIYDRGPNQNPVIHRAILWLDYNETNKTWSAPSLKDYPSDRWSCVKDGTPITDYNNLSGTLTLKYMGYKETPIDINLNSLGTNSGYITMGDHNGVIDQNGIVSGLVTYESIKSVAWIEIPWMGSIKLMLDGKSNVLSSKVPNTVPSLAAAILLIIFLIIGIGFLNDQRYYRKYKKELYAEMNAPTPLFPVEKKKK